MEKRTLFFTMVLHPINGWIRVGKAYPSRASASEWMPLVRGKWRGFRTKIAQCTIRLVDGKPCEKSRKVLDVKFNLDC